jgi:hypothetical protein
MTAMPIVDSTDSQPRFKMATKTCPVLHAVFSWAGNLQYECLGECLPVTSERGSRLGAAILVADVSLAVLRAHVVSDGP